MKRLFRTLGRAAGLWYEKDADYMAATMSYYTLFAAVPLLLLTVTIASVVYGNDLVVATLRNWGEVLGPGVVELLHSAVNNLEALTYNFSFPIVGAIFFSGMVIVLLNAFTTGLHQLWGIPHRGVRGWVEKCLHSLVFVVALEIYLVVLLGFAYVANFMITDTGYFFYALSKLVFFILATTILFSLMYRILPWQAPPLAARLIGALVASCLFAVAKLLVALYVSATPVPDLFGAAGLIIVLLIWIYVSAAILYYGAAVAHEWNQNTET